MHASPTVDFDYILSGRLVLELEGGARVELGPGDTLIQNGARHLWSNPFDEPRQLGNVMIGARRQ
jgi:quercetin dioxygenase-like cupin family protein